MYNSNKFNYEYNKIKKVQEIIKGNICIEKSCKISFNKLNTNRFVILLYWFNIKILNEKLNLIFQILELNKKEQNILKKYSNNWYINKNVIVEIAVAFDNNKKKFYVTYSTNKEKTKFNIDSIETNLLTGNFNYRYYQDIFISKNNIFKIINSFDNNIIISVINLFNLKTWEKILERRKNNLLSWHIRINNPIKISENLKKINNLLKIFNVNEKKINNIGKYIYWFSIGVNDNNKPEINMYIRDSL